MYALLAWASLILTVVWVIRLARTAIEPSHHRTHAPLSALVRRGRHFAGTSL